MSKETNSPTPTTARSKATNESKLTSAHKTKYPHPNVKRGKEGGVKGKGFAKGEPLGAGETPRFALGFVVSPAPIGSPFAGVAQANINHKGIVAYSRRGWETIYVCIFPLSLCDGNRKTQAFFLFLF